MSRFRRFSVLAFAAAVVLFAIVGSALARGSRGEAKPVYQQKCATGAVKGVVGISGNAAVGFQKDYSGALVTTKWSCKAGAVPQARRIDRGIYDVRITGLPGTPVVTPLGGPAKIGVRPLGDGGIEVHLLGIVNGAETEVDEPFVVVFV